MPPRHCVRAALVAAACVALALFGPVCVAQPLADGPLARTQSPQPSALAGNDRFTAADELPLATSAPPKSPLVTLLTDEQLKAIGVKSTETAATTTTATAPATDDDGDDRERVHTRQPTSTHAVSAEATADPSAAPTTVLTGSIAADLSIDHVEAHLVILQELELSVARSIEALNARNSDPFDNAAVDLAELTLELQNIQKNLKKLAEGLSGTLQDLEVVEKDTEAKAKKLEAVLEIQQEEKEEQFIEENGIKEVDYETGHLRNSTKLKLSRAHREKLEAAEKKVDPAVLHYDFELLGQIAILLGVSAIGGIVATYFNIPPNIGYLLGGALVGPSCLMIVKQFKEVETISLFGSIFLLFGHGASYTPQQFDRLGLKKYLLTGVAYIAGTVLLVALVSVYLGWSASFSEGITVGIAVSFTTTAPLFEHIRANQIQDTSYGRTLIAIIAVQDILMSFALGTPEWFSVRSVGFVGIAAVRSIIAYAIVVVLTLGLHLHVVPRLLAFLTAMEQVHHSPLVLLGVVSVCLFMALFTESIGLSLECGAFLAGLAFVNVSRDAQGAFTSIRVMENLFGSMFFACVGMILNPMFLIKNAGEILSMVILIVVIKACSMTVVMTVNRMVSIDKAMLAGVGLCQVGELALIFIIKAHATKLVSRRIYLLFVAAIAVFLGCSSIFNRRVVLARRKKTVFRLPTIMARRRTPNGSGNEDATADERNRGDSDAAPLSPSSTSRERRFMHKTPSMH